MRRRSVLLALASATAGLAGCGGPEPPPPPPPPTVLKLTLQASPAANADGSGVPKPLRVRILRLASTTKLAQADFFALDADPEKALGKELVGFDELVLAPGQSLAYEHEFEPEARLVGVAAAYYDINAAQWRAWAPVPRDQMTVMTARLEPSGVSFAEPAS
jgi:type VI secretion system protein VasD